MSDLKKIVTDEVANVQNAISDSDEATEVMKSIHNIIDAFSNALLEVSRRQTKLEEKTEEIFETLSNIEEELVQGLADDFEAECPYCGEEISYAIPEDGSDFECPKCHNTIELEMMFDDCDCGCHDCHDSCNGCHDDEDDEK